MSAEPVAVAPVTDEQQQLQDIETARELAVAGVPIFIARVALDEAGQWDPTGGHNGCGYTLPPAWQNTSADPAVLDQWRPGMAVCAVMGGPLNALDVDPRSGGQETADGLASAGLWPQVIGSASTPSGGRHDFVGALDVGSRDNLRHGLDVKGGRPDGTSRGFVFLAPTRKRSKVDDVVRAYAWTQAPMLEELDESDDSGSAIAEMIRNARSSSDLTAGGEPGKPKYEGPAYADLPQGEQSRLARYTARVIGDELARLDACRAAAVPSGASLDSYRGEPWDRTTFSVACQLFDFAESSWSPLTIARAVALVREHAPRDKGFGPREVTAKMRSALTRQSAGQGRALPTPTAPSSDPLSPDYVAPGVEVATGEAETDDLALARARRDNLTEADVAARFALDHLVGRWVWCPSLLWLHYDGRVWRRQTGEAKIIELARRAAVRRHNDESRRLHAAAGQQQRPLSEGEKTYLNKLEGMLRANALGNVVRLARGIVEVAVEKFDANPHYLNCGNGIVDLRTGALLPHAPEQYLTRITPTRYVPGATHSDWHEALRALPDDVAPWLQERAGQAATAHQPPDDIIPVLQGGGENGKTTIMGALMSALGEHATLISDRVLLADASAHPTEKMELRGARFAVVEELPNGHELQIAKIKKITGTAKIEARYIAANSVTFPPTHSLFLTSNYRPMIRETDHGTWRRFALVHFPYRFRKPHEPLDGPQDRRGDATLRQRVASGAGGQHEAVLTWVVEGARRWFAADQVLSAPPASVLADTAAWRSESDVVIGFVSERLVFDRHAMVLSSELYEDFNSYLKDTGHRPWAENTFKGRFLDHDDVRGAGVAATRARDFTGLSRAPGELVPGTPVGQVRVVTGIRFAAQGRDGEVF